VSTHSPTEVSGEVGRSGYALDAANFPPFSVDCIEVEYPVGPVDTAYRDGVSGVVGYDSFRNGVGSANIGAFRRSEKGSAFASALTALLLRRLMRKNARPISRMAAMPPTTPPAISPVFEVDPDDDGDEGHNPSCVYMNEYKSR